MALVEKDIPLSAFERAALEKSSSGAGVIALPLPLMRWFVLRNIESFRNPKGITMPLMPECAHQLVYTRHEISGEPKPVGISVCCRAEDEGKGRPLLFFIHGGGFLGGDSRMNEGLMRYITDKTGVVTASVDYNVAPEVKHPVPLTDCRRALGYVLEHYVINREKIFLSGDSAGGNLAAGIFEPVKKFAASPLA